jgi:cell wall assembly regulator SMI1
MAGHEGVANEVHFQGRPESRPDNAVKPDWWNLLWIPIASDGSGNLTCIDMDPGYSGTSGQIIDFDHETPHRCVVASNFCAAVQAYIKRVLAGEYTYSDDYGRLIPTADL